MINSNGLSIKFRILFTATVTILVWIHLIWDHFNGGVPTHYLLQSEDMPGISNWWGGITLPLTTFLLLLWVHKNQLKAPEQENNKLSRKLIMRFFSSLLVCGSIICPFFYGVTRTRIHDVSGHNAFIFCTPLPSGIPTGLDPRYELYFWG